MSKKALLLKITALAYNGDEMSLLSGVYARRWDDDKMDLVLDPTNDLTEEMAATPSPNWGRTPLDVLKHVADCKTMYMKQAFGETLSPHPECNDTLESHLQYLDATHREVTTRLSSLSEEDLEQPVPTQCHGESAANLFWVLAQHDVYNGAYINAIRKVIEK